MGHSAVTLGPKENNGTPCHWPDGCWNFFLIPGVFWLGTAATVSMRRKLGPPRGRSARISRTVLRPCFSGTQKPSDRGQFARCARGVRQRTPVRQSHHLRPPATIHHHPLRRTHHLPLRPQHLRQPLRHLLGLLQAHFMAGAPHHALCHVLEAAPDDALSNGCGGDVHEHH